MSLAVEPLVLGLATGEPDPQLRALIIVVANLCSLAQPPMLFYFLDYWPTRSAQASPGQVARGAFRVFLALGALDFILAVFLPGPFLGEADTVWGPLGPVLVIVPRFVGLALALAYLARLPAAPEDEPQRQRLFLGLWPLIVFEAGATLLGASSRCCSRPCWPWRSRRSCQLRPSARSWFSSQSSSSAVARLRHPRRLPLSDERGGT